MARDTKRTKKKASKNIATGVAHVNSSFNNTKILISDVQGNAIAWSSAGTMGFKGSRKSTPYAAQMAAEDAGRKAQEHGMKTLEVEVQLKQPPRRMKQLRLLYEELVRPLLMSARH